MDIGIEFRDRYFRFALSAAGREANRSFERLRLMHSATSMGYVRMMDSISPSERDDLVKAFVKYRLCRQFATTEIAGEQLSLAERLKCEAFFDEWGERHSDELDFEAMSARDPKLFRIDRKGLIGNLRRGLSGATGIEIPSSNACELWFEIQLGKWKVQTFAEIGSRSGQICYFQRVAGSKCMLMPALSIVSWVGVRGGDARWIYCTAEEQQIAVTHLISACEEFVNSAPGLLNGL